MQIKIVYEILVLVFLLLAGVLKVDATIYYVSNNGNDSNSGLTPEQSWKTLDKVNRVFIKPGDQVLFKSGDVWHGTLRVRFSGKKDNPITFGSYGSGHKPLFSGFTEINDWQDEGGGVYSKNLNVESFPEIVTVNGVQYAMGRTPNSNRYKLSSQDYYHIDEVKGTNQFIDQECNSSEINWTGAEIVLRSSNFWDWIREKIIYHSGTLIKFEESGDPIEKGFGYFIQNDIRTLDQFGEWFYGNGKFYMFFGGADPNDYVVKVSTINKLIDINTKSYILIHNIKFEGANLQAVGTNYAAQSTDINIDNCDFDYNMTSVYGHWTSNCRVTKCIIMRSSDRAVYLHWNIEGYYIAKNKVDSTGLIIGVAKGTIDAKTMSGISATFYNLNGSTYKGIIESNIVTNSGNYGISFIGDSAVARNNYVEGFCLRTSDGGGIHRDAFAGFYNMIIDHNIIRKGGINTDALGLPVGTTNGRQYGIYIDVYSYYITISNNTIINSSGGIHILGGQNVQIFGNTPYACNTGIMLHQRDPNTDAIRGIKMNSNVVVGNDASQKLCSFRSERYDFNQFGNISENVYANLENNNRSFVTMVNNWIPTYRTLSEWQSYTGQDSNSKFVSIKSSQGESSELFYNATESSVKYFLGSQTFRDVYGNVIADSFELKPFESLVLIGKNFEMVNRKPQISEQSFNFYLPKFENDSLGQVFASDPDTDQTLFFKITGGNEQGLFRIDSLTGILYAATDINLTGKNEFQLIVAVEDNSVNPQMQQAVLTIHIEGSDSSPPVITFFSIPPRAFTLKVPIENLLTSDDAAVAGYLLSQTENLPSVDDTSWTPIPPTFFSFVSQGSNVLYAFVKDTAGNISLPVFDTVFIALPDLSPKYSEYLFEEPEGAEIIDSNNNNNGTIVYEAERIFGITGQAMSFTGLGFIFIGPAYGENVKNEVTLSAWIKPKQSADLGYQGIIMHGGPEIDSYALYINPGIRSIGFQTRGTSSAWLVLENVDELWDGNWHHIASVYDGTEKRIYLDGKALITVTAEGEIDSGFGYNLLLGAGRDEATPSLLYKGEMDNVRIYNYAIDENEVTELFDSVNRQLKKVEVSENVSICEGEDYWGWTEPGEYVRTLQRKAPGTSQADSVVTTYLQVNPVFSETEEITIKEGENYKGWTETGIYEEKYSSVLGCDSIFIIDLTVIPAIYTVEDVTICEGESYLGYNEPGQYQRIFPASTGGDSIVITNLSINPVYSTTENVSILYGDNYNGWTESGQYTRNLTSMYMCDSMVITNLTVTEPLIQEIELKTGWNIFSSYIQPIELLFDDLLNPLRSQNLLIEVKDELENSFHRKNGEWVNNIGNWLKTEGYKIKVNADCILKLTGVPVSLPLNIPVKKGWNIISFPYNGKVDALNVVEPLINAGVLKKIQDERGNAIEYWGDNLGWINAIGSFEAGEGYIVQVTGEADLPILINFDKSSELVSENPKPVHFKPVFSGNGFSHMNINITGLYKSGLEPGDEIGAFDGENCVGVFKLTESNIAQNIVSINASATDADSLNGFIENNPVLLKLWKENQGKEFGVQYEVLNGEMVFRNYGSVFLDLLKIFEINPGGGELPQVKIYPNPVSRDFTVEFSKMPENNTNIVFSDLAGKIIATRVVTSEKENFYMAALPPGIYQVKVALPQITYIKKIVVR